MKTIWWITIFVLLLLSGVVVRSLDNHQYTVEINELKQQWQQPNFDECQKDLLCYYESFVEWADLINIDGGNFSCGLILYGQPQMFAKLSNDYVGTKLNYCDYDEHIYSELKNYNITDYRILKVLYADKHGDEMSVRYDEYNYNIASCFMATLFNQSKKGHFEILEECETKILAEEK